MTSESDYDDEVADTADISATNVLNITTRYGFNNVIGIGYGQMVELQSVLNYVAIVIYMLRVIY